MTINVNGREMTKDQFDQELRIHGHNACCERCFPGWSWPLRNSCPMSYTDMRPDKSYQTFRGWFTSRVIKRLDDLNGEVKKLNGEVKNFNETFIGEVKIFNGEAKKFNETFNGEVKKFNGEKKNFNGTFIGEVKKFNETFSGEVKKFNTIVGIGVIGGLMLGVASLTLQNSMFLRRYATVRPNARTARTAATLRNSGRKRDLRL